MDIDRARFNMVEQQIRPWNVLDQKILDLFIEIPREVFVDPKYKSLAFADIEIPLPNGSRMLAPKIEAKMVQELQLQSADKVLEIGTGNAYVSAVMAKLCKHVYSFDLDPMVINSAKGKLKKLNISNVTFFVEDGLRGCLEHSPFNAIMIGGAVESVPKVLIDQLAAGGRLVAVVGKTEDKIQKAVLLEKRDSILEVSLFETHVSSLVSKSNDRDFVF